MWNVLIVQVTRQQPNPKRNGDFYYVADSGTRRYFILFSLRVELIRISIQLLPKRCTFKIFVCRTTYFKFYTIVTRLQRFYSRTEVTYATHHTSTAWTSLNLGYIHFQGTTDGFSIIAIKLNRPKSKLHHND